MNLPVVLTALSLERPSSPPAPEAPPAEAAARAPRREETFDQALRQQLGGPPAGQAANQRAAGGPQAWWAQPFLINPGAFDAGTEPFTANRAERGDLPRGLGALLRGEGRQGPEQPDAPRGLVATLETGPVWIAVPLPESLPAAGEGSPVTIAELPRTVLGQVRQTVDRQTPVTQLEFQLLPPALGPVNLQVSYTQGVVGVQLTALTLAARQTLESQAGQIQAILQAHNLTPGPIRVVAPASGRAGASGAGLRQDAGGFGGGLQGRRRQSGASDAAIDRA